MVICQSLWIGDKLSLMEYGCIKSFLKHGYEFHLYVYGEVENIPEGVVIKDGNQILNKNDIFKEHGSILPFADLFRFKMLYLCGGCWVDLDIICLKPFDEMLTKDILFSSERTMKKGAYKSNNPTCPSINFMYSKKNKEIIFEELYLMLLYKKGNMRNELEGMKVIKEFFKKKHPELKDNILPPEHVNNMDWWHYQEFYLDKEFKMKYGVEPNLPITQGYMLHCWRNMFRRFKNRKGLYSQLTFNKPVVGSLYDTLIEEYMEDYTFDYTY
tara:strand:- start:4406 stop:5215 length:810 start_codon:yes stop_codon:yes gene_type:complete